MIVNFDNVHAQKRDHFVFAHVSDFVNLFNEKF
jgi:hypothetical protein